MEPVANQSTESRETSSAHHHTRRSKTGQKKAPRTPIVLGLTMFAAILLVSAGATFFILTKPSDDERLYRQGIMQLDKGQYAFAVESLKEATTLKPKDTKVHLALARAYIGVDQLDNAWQSISQAQQLGAGVIEDPKLASDLANYYRLHQKFAKAVELLRPLAQANVRGKKEELADLDANWGDEALRQGDFEQALKCWEEVRELKSGSRYREAEARLSTIYRKITNQLVADKSDTEALSYITKLNAIAPNPRNYRMAADIYERQGKLELAIDQLRKAMKLGQESSAVQKQLASLMRKYGQNLLDAGDTEAGYGYLQKARALDPTSNLPEVTLKNVEVKIDRKTRFPSISGEIWNPGPDPINYLTLRVDVYNPVTEKVSWSRERSIIDEFELPLTAKDSKKFVIYSNVPVSSGSASEMRVYLDGNLYKSYGFHRVSAPVKAQSSDVINPDTGSTDRLRPPIEDSQPKPVLTPTPARATAPTPTATPPQEDPYAVPAMPQTPGEQTMGDLDF